MDVKVNVNVKESTMVRPAGETPKRALWSSSLDLAVTRFLARDLFELFWEGC
jgi:hypothetical protein